jgi:hypothetical protein
LCNTFFLSSCDAKDSEETIVKKQHSTEAKFSLFTSIKDTAATKSRGAL